MYIFSKYIQKRKKMGMKLTITKEDLKLALLRQTGVDISKVAVDVEIEGYIKAKDFRLKARIEENIDDAPRTTVTTDSNMNVLSIVHDTTTFEKPQLSLGKEPKKIKNSSKKRKYTYAGRVDYKKYENEILDFATSSEQKRRVPTFGINLAANKERYKKAIVKSGTEDMVKFTSIDKEPWLIKVTSEEVPENVSNE